MKAKQTHMAVATTSPTITHLAMLPRTAYALDRWGDLQQVLALAVVDEAGVQRIEPVVLDAYDVCEYRLTLAEPGWHWLPAEEFEEGQHRAFQQRMANAWERFAEREKDLPDLLDLLDLS